MGVKRELMDIVLDIGTLLGFAFFLFGLYLLKPALAPLVGGPIVSAACFLLGYDRTRRRTESR